MKKSLPINIIVGGEAVTAEVLMLDEPLSFWGGLDPESGNIIDVHHPQYQQCIRGKILVLPGTRGSTAGPGALLEAMYQGNGPAAIVLSEPDIAAMIAVVSAEYIGLEKIPIVSLVKPDNDSAEIVPISSEVWFLSTELCEFSSGSLPPTA